MKRTKLVVVLACATALSAAAPAEAVPTIAEFDLPTAGAQPQDIVLGPDGNVWFAERGISKIGRISPSNTAQIDEFPTKNAGAGPDIIIVGPDGNIWFTEQSGDSIGRISPANPAAPDSFGGLGIQDPRGIAVGPDGNLWVADADSVNPEVVIVSPAGAKVGSVDLPAAFNARNIARGPDNNMWVAGFSSNKIVRIITSGTPAVDPPNGYDTPGITPLDILAGTDGNLWFTAQGTTVGRITPVGAINTFTTLGVDPFGMTVGPDGAIWYAEFQAGAIGRVDAAGVTSHVEGLTAGAGPRYVTGGAGDTLWFTEDAGNRVGRVSGIELPQGPQPLPQPLPQPQPPADLIAPDVTGLRLTRARFRLGNALPRVAAVGIGTTIRFTISEAASARLSFSRLLPGRRVGGRCRRPTRLNRDRPRCTRRVAVRPTITRPVEAGARRIRFSGRLTRTRSLLPGSYELRLTATDAAGNVSTPDRARFRLLPRRG